MLAAGLAGEKGRRERPDGAAAREDEPCPRLARRHRLSSRRPASTSSLEKVGFYTVGYGCTTCIGNSGPLPEPIAQAVKKNDLVVAGVLSRQSQLRGPDQSADVKANYLASPPLVVAYALAGTTDIDLAERADRHRHGRPARVPEGYLADARARSQSVVDKCVLPEMFREAIRRRLEQEPKVERHQNERGRVVRLGSHEHVHSRAAVPVRSLGASRRRSSRSAVRGAWRRSAIP